MIEFMHISVIGIIYLLMLFVPNIIWSKYQPVGYDPSHENKTLLFCERVGQVFVTAFAVIIFNEPRFDLDIILILSMICMALYECFWIRYFKGEKSLNNFYRPFFKIPVPGASLPVVAFFLLGIYQLNIPLIISVIILGIGHIGIHLQHFSEIEK